MRELMRELLSANLFVTGVILFIGAIITFYGAIYLLTWTNLGKKLGFLVTGAAIGGWMTIGSLLYVLYAPRGPRPVQIEGLGPFEIRIIPITYMVVSFIIFVAFVVALHQYERAQEGD